MVDGGVGWCKEGRLSSLFKPRVPGVLSLFDKTNGSRGSSTVGRRLGWEGRPAPVESFNFPLLFLMILHLWSFVSSGNNAYMISHRERPSEN